MFPAVKREDYSCSWTYPLIAEERYVHSFPFCLTFLFLGEEGFSLHSYVTSDLLSFESENVVLIFLCLIWWPAEVPLCCTAGFGYASTARACGARMGPHGRAFKRALNWLFCGFSCRGSFCESAMRTSEELPREAQLLSIICR